MLDKEYQLKKAGILLQEKLSNSYCTVTLDFNKFVYFLIHDEPREFTNTSKNGKEYKVNAWKIADKWISVFKDFTFKCSWGKWLIVLDPKFNQKTIDFLTEVFKSNYNPYEIKHITKNAEVEIEYHGSLKIKVEVERDGIDQELESQEHKEKMGKLQKSIEQTREEELIKKIDTLQNIAFNQLKAKDIVSDLVFQKHLNTADINLCLEMIIKQTFMFKFLDSEKLIELITNINQLRKDLYKTKKYNLNEHLNIYINQFANAAWEEKRVADLEDWSKVAEDEEDKVINANEKELKEREKQQDESL